MTTQTAVYMSLMEKGATRTKSIPGQPGPAYINNPEDEVTMAMATENTILYNMGKKIWFLVIVIGETRYRVKIGDDTLELFNTGNPGPYD